ncbi:GNAT family N-acetyltransferase [Flagellimonas meridianipacifica]|uniref:Acetyltransferase (GNAT) family protein n=1 Tax=Flagellimonas meridianipacifica TaxID=1080225 RepID=A0A2T0MCQ2_9FLAO|nr:GNAT family N-acetyltransferase [Allomuricauda pacifica]PRX55277.1 acetyltransferase (GNAT) family protein [Allomuricauda pacifica]
MNPNQYTYPIKVDFLDDFLEKRSEIPHVLNVENTWSNISNYVPEANALKLSEKSHFLIYDVPSYIKLSYARHMGTIPIKSYEGSVIYLSNYIDFEDFAKKKWSAKRRSLLKNYEKRLRYSLEISTKVYCGHMGRTYFDSLFNHFRKLIERRFNEKQMQHDDLKNWERYRSTIYPLLLKKQACISVIYHGEKPISFSVNIIYANAMYGYLKSYDTDYSKFSLGFVELNLLLRWAFMNDIKMFDLLKGRYEYKMKLIDAEYPFMKEVVYNKESISSRFFSHITALKIRAFYSTVRVLKQLKLDVLIHKILSIINGRKTSGDYKTIIPTYKVRDENTDSISKKKLTIIDIEQEPFSELRRAVYSFLYTNNEKLDDLKVYKNVEENNSFVIQGKELVQSITIT